MNENYNDAGDGSVQEIAANHENPISTGPLLPAKNRPGLAGHSAPFEGIAMSICSLPAGQPDQWKMIDERETPFAKSGLGLSPKTITAEATNLPSQSAAQEDNQVENHPVETTASEWETMSKEGAVAAKWQPKLVTFSVEAPLALTVKTKIQAGMVPVALLRPYARNGEIYQDREDPLFTENIRKNGVLTDLVVTEDGEVLGGNRRLREAKRSGLLEVPVKVVVCRTEDDKMLRVLDDNVQRAKSKVEIAREYVERLKVESRAAVLRKVEAGKKAKGQGEEVKTFAPPAGANGKARDKAAKELDLSGVTAEKGRKVLEAVAKARTQGASEVADELLEKLNDEGFHSAFKRAQALKLIVPAVKKAPKPRAAAPVAPEADQVAAEAVAGDAEEADPIAQDDSDDAVVANYILAVGKLQDVMAAKLTLDQRANLLRAQDDVQGWFGHNTLVLHEKH